MRNTSLIGRISMLLAISVVLIAERGLAQSPNAPPNTKPAEQGPVREIFVPFEDLNVILENDKERVFLTRDEYEELVKAARHKPQIAAPHKLILVAAEYQGRLDDGRATISGKLTIEVLEEGLFAFPLELAGVGLRSATLDGKAAPIARHVEAAGRTVPGPHLLVQGKGLHQLELKLTAQVQTSAAQQTLQFTLPTNAATQLSLSVAGNIDVKGGAAVVRRTYDDAAHRTELEILPQRGGMSLVMSLNNRLLQQQRVMVARSVIVDEVTQGYERIHATISFRVLHGAADNLRLAIPAGFEVTKVDSVLLARWQEQPGPEDRKILELTLREATSDQVTIHLTANRSPSATADWLAGLTEWQFPKLEPLDTAGHVAILGLVVENRLQPQSIETVGLVPIDSAALASAIPASVLQAEPGAPDVRQVVSYFAPSGDYSLTASFIRPAAALKVATNSLLLIGDQGLTLQGGFALTPQAESLHSFAFTLPPGWQLTQVSLPEGSELPVERYPLAAGGTRVTVRLPQAIPLGHTRTINYQALFPPPGWLAEWTAQNIEFPKVFVEGATSDSGAIAAQAVDDLVVRPATLTGLTPLLDNEKAAFGLGNIPTALAYRFENRDFAAGLVVERTNPSIAAQVHSFIKLERDNLVAHYELHYIVREARARTLVFSLPVATPTELTIRGLGNIAVKEFSSRDEGDRRHWTVQLADRHVGNVRLAIDFSQRLPENSQQNAILPLARAEGVEYQSGLVAVESSADLDVSVTAAQARQVDVGELTSAEHPLGRRVVATFGYVGTLVEIRATSIRRDPYGLPPALVQRAELVTQVSASGRAQSVARYELLTKATLLEIRLPLESSLWTIYLDDQPTKPQREGASLLLSLPAQQQLAVRKLQIVYESPAGSLGLSGKVEAVAPLLLVRAAGTDAQREIPQADLQWQLVLPSGYVIRRVGGSLETDEIAERELAAMKVARWLFDLAGGIRRGRLSAASNGLSDIKSAFDGVSSIRTENLSSATIAAPVDEATPLAASAGEPQPNAARKLSRNDQLSRESEVQKLAQLQERLQEPAAEQKTANAPSSGPARPGETADFESRRKGLWALDGVSSLQINIESDTSPAVTFRSLGEEPRLAAFVIDQRRVDAAAWGMALLVGLVGVGLSSRPARDQATWVVILLLASTVPLLLTPAFDEVAQVFDYVFFAGCGLAAWYVVVALSQPVHRWAARNLPAQWWQPTSATQTTSVVILAFGLLACSQTGIAQEPPLPESVRIANIKDLVPLLDRDQTPVAIPRDAVIVPYDPEKPIEAAGAEKILVPYAKYVELWNAANPDKPLTAVLPPIGFAIAGTAYEATLTAGDFVSLVGRMEIDLYDDKPLAVPLNLTGGVLERATVDGQPARLQIAEPQRPTKTDEKTARSKTTPPPQRLLFLHLSGKGRKSVQLHIRLGLARQGGWRIVRGQLPGGPAVSLTMLVPDVGTEVRQTGLADRANFETQAASEKIELALGSDGLLNLQWRPKVAEGMVDQALTTYSLAVFDVREDSLRLTWQVQLGFGRAYRDSFSLFAPADYLVEQVAGENVRGWTAKPDAGGQRIDVTLLKPAQRNETLTLHLSKRGRISQGELAQFEAPSVRVEGAALEQGEIAVRRSPRLELQTVAAGGLTRADSSQQMTPVLQLADAVEAAVLVVKPFQTFRFARPPFRLTLSAAELLQETSAEVRAVLRVAERDTTLDAAITFRPKGQPMYQVRLYLPDGFTLDRVGPANLEWSVTTEDGRQLLTVLLLDGRTEEFVLTLLGKIASSILTAAPNEPRSLAAPRIEILDVVKQEGEIVIIPDPDIALRIDAARNVEGLPITTPPAWLKPEQQPLAKAVLRYRTVDYSASVVLTPRSPLVSVSTITNVKITPTSIQETMMLEFQIEQAGIRRVTFLAPEHLAKARIKALLLKQKTIEPATSADGQPIAGMVRMTLELQDFVRGKYAVLLEHDRLLAGDRQTVALPIIETGRTDRRLVALENASRDELVVADVAGLEPVNRQQKAWRELAAVVGESVTAAYIAQEASPRPSLAFSTLQRQEAQKRSARIGLATTLLVVDGSGAYRALVQYRATNATEQFLELTLPASARLWTALVAGEPVKPAEAIPPRPGVVRIPLVKTAEGEGDYVVELKYGGRMTGSAALSAASFPLIRQTSINVEQTIVRLLLPNSQQYYNFGGTMRLVEDESELAETFQFYLGKRIQEAAQALSSSSDYTKVRAAVNLKQSRALLEGSRSLVDGEAARWGAAAQNLQQTNESLLGRAEQQVQIELAEQKAEQLDNRVRLNEYFGSQQFYRSKNVVSDLTSNFDAPATAGGGGEAGEGFNSQWLDQNNLRTNGKLAGIQDKDALLLPAKPAPGAAGAPEAGGTRLSRAGKPGGDDGAVRDLSADSKAPELAARKELEELKKKLGDESEARLSDSRRAGGERATQLDRYQQNLEMSIAPGQQAQGQQSGGGGYGAAGRGGFGYFAAPQSPPARPELAMGGMGGAYAQLPGGSAGVAFTPMAGEELSRLAAGLASLDVQLPERGRLYRFTTPRGDAEITARSVSVSVLSRLSGLGMVLVATFGVWLLVREPSRRVWGQLANSLACGIGLIVIGLASIVVGVLPLAGLLVIVTGIVIAIRSRLPSAAAATAPA